MSEQKNKDDFSTFPALGWMLLWVDTKQNGTRLFYGLSLVCAILFGADFLYVKKAYVAVEYFPGFYALFGFFACAALVICARGLQVLLKRSEDYYAPLDVESEDYPEDQLEKCRSQ